MPGLRQTSTQGRNEALEALRFLPPPDVVTVLGVVSSVPLRTRLPPVGLNAFGLQGLSPLLKAPAVETPHVVNPDLTEQLRLKVAPMSQFCRAAIDQHQHSAGGTGGPEGISTPAASCLLYTSPSPRD